MRATDCNLATMLDGVSTLIEPATMGAEMQSCTCVNSLAHLREPCTVASLVARSLSGHKISLASSSTSKLWQRHYPWRCNRLDCGHP